MQSHLPPDTPDIRDRALLQHPVALGLVAEVYDPATLRLPFFGGMVGELAEGFRTSNSDTDGDASALVNLGTDPSTECLKITWNAG